MATSSPAGISMKPALRLSGAALALAFCSGAHADGFSDTSIGYRYSDAIRDPGALRPDGRAADIGRGYWNLTHVDASAYGGNFLSVDWQMSNMAAPNRRGDAGMRELYLIYRRTIDPAGWSGHSYGFGPVQSTTLIAGFDFANSTAAYEVRKRMLVIGPQFAFGLPRGFFKVALLAEKEYDHNGIVRRTENFDLTWAAESSWALPFQLGPLPAQFEGYLDVYGPKGHDQFGHGTRTETLFHPRLMFDLGAPAGHPNRIWAGVGYEYWHAKFGVDPSITEGAIQHAALVELAVHL